MLCLVVIKSNKGNAALVNGRKAKSKTYGKFENRTKIDVFKSAKNWQSARSMIVEHARNSYLSSTKPKACMVCGYDRIIQIAHVKAVSDFDDDALILEINSLKNLKALCPTHHAEYDKGIFQEIEFADGAGI